MGERIRVQHLLVQCIEQSAGILNDLREIAESAEQSGEYGDRASRFRSACIAVGAVLDHDIEPEKVLSRPVRWTDKIRQIAIGSSPAKN